MIAWLLFVLVLGLSYALYVSVKRNLSMMEQLESIKQQVDESLDIIDYVYGRIVSKAKTEVMSDEPLVRELVSDMQAAKDAMILVANKIVLPFIENEEEDEDKD